MTRTEPSTRATAPGFVVVFVGLMLGNALSSLDGTIVATALPTIVGDLHGLTNLSWVVTAYLLLNVATMPLYGKLGDLYGRKRVLLIAIGIFLVGSVLCGAAASMTQLIVFRAVQGIGAGGLNSLPMAAVGDLVPARERARWIGYSGFVFAFSAVLGPVLGGLFTDHLSWRWAFYINVPLGLLSMAIIVRRYHVPERRHASPHRLPGCRAHRRRGDVHRPAVRLGRHARAVGLAGDHRARPRRGRARARVRGLGAARRGTADADAALRELDRARCASGSTCSSGWSSTPGSSSSPCSCSS